MNGGGLDCQRPELVGGNQVIITSRRTGYYLYPVHGKSLHFTYLE